MLSRRPITEEVKRGVIITNGFVKDCGGIDATGGKICDAIELCLIEVTVLLLHTHERAICG